MSALGLEFLRRERVQRLLYGSLNQIFNSGKCSHRADIDDIVAAEIRNDPRGINRAMQAISREKPRDNDRLLQSGHGFAQERALLEQRELNCAEPSAAVNRVGEIAGRL